MSSDDDDERRLAKRAKLDQEDDTVRPTDMYLDTIDRTALDFDFERLCSVTLSHHHVYSCLVCGKFFQGRGAKSPAYAHSIGPEDHHVFVNLESRRCYVLPDGYEVDDPSLNDIRHLLQPTFTRETLDELDHSLTPKYDLVGHAYYPGFIGVNNVKHNSYINSILVSLAHVRPLRDYFILDHRPNNQESSQLVKRFSLFLKKFWNPRQFKSQVSPHELLQQIDLDSKGRFKLNDTTEGGRGDPGEFLSWFLNQLHRDLGGNRKPNSSIIYSTFQGELRIDDQQVLKSGEYGSKPKFDLDREIKTTKTPFLFLTLDLPPPPLFQSHLQNDIIPQISLQSLLSKYNGHTTLETLLPSTTTGGGGGGGETTTLTKNELNLRRFKLERLPEFVVLWVKRFRTNRFQEEEKNPTIVNFPLRGVDFKDCKFPPFWFERRIEPEVKPEFEKKPLIPLSLSFTDVDHEEGGDALEKYYDLVSNVTHTSLAGTARSETQWKTYVHLTPARDSRGEGFLPIRRGGGGGGGGTTEKTTTTEEERKTDDDDDDEKKKKDKTTRIVKEEDEKWFEMQDLTVQEIEKGLVGLGESYIQIWERRRPFGKHEVEVEQPKPKIKGVAGQVLHRQQQQQQQQKRK
ncbi:hypothetical protein JCM3766R1_004068 [Sporobolomyces carnicolor]